MRVKQRLDPFFLTPFYRFLQSSYLESLLVRIAGSIKLQKVLSTNHHIDTVLVSFSPRNIFDTNWMFELENSQSRMGVYYPLMSFNDYKYIHKQNIKTMCQSLPYMVKRSGINCIKKIIGKEIKYPGKHLALDRNIVLQELQKLKNREETSFIEISGKLKLAVHEVFYLKKIDSLCQKRQIALLFINTPKRPELLVFPNYGVTKFNKFYTEHFSHIPYIDLSAFPLPDQYYADLVHLNKQGAIHFSKNLKENNYIKP